MEVIEILAKKYARRVLTRLENKQLITAEIRKIILDGFNDLVRESLSRSPAKDKPVIR